MSRDSVDDVKSISTTFLKESGRLVYGVHFKNQVVRWTRHGTVTGKVGYELALTETERFIRFNYRVRDYDSEPWRDIVQKFVLVPTRCNFGGHRWYFKCHCGKRVSFLYLVHSRFACRTCQNLTYDSCKFGKQLHNGIWGDIFNETKADKLQEKIKRTHYNGRPTRKYRRYLRLCGYKGDFSDV